MLKSYDMSIALTSPKEIKEIKEMLPSTMESAVLVEVIITNSNLFSTLFHLISIFIKSIIVLLSLSVIFIVIKNLLIMEVKMENIISVLAVILTSSVISALISTNASSRMKGKELEVKLKLEEKNKWVENINKAYKDYMDSTTEYIQGFMDYALNKISDEHVINLLNTISKAHNSLIFYMYQAEYNLSEVDKIEKLIKKTAGYLNEQKEIALDYRIEPQPKDKIELRNKMSEIEGKVGMNNHDFSKKIGKMVSKEKEKMTTKIIERK